MRWISLVLVIAACGPKKPAEPPPSSAPPDAAPPVAPDAVAAAPTPPPPACTKRVMWAVFDPETDANLEPAARVFADAFRSEAQSDACIELKLTAATHAESKATMNCESEHPQCMAAIGAGLGVDELVFGKIERIGRRQLHISMRHLSVARRQLVAQWQTTIESTVDIGKAGVDAFIKLSGHSP